MRFGFESYLHLFWVVPALVLFFVLVFRRRKKDLARFSDPGFVEALTRGLSSRKRRYKVYLLVAAAALMIAALVDPQFGTRLREVKREGIDIFVALDVSLSMNAEDIKPNRLLRAKYLISNLIDRLEGDRIGLVVFSGDAFIQCPITLDHDAAKMFLNAVDTDITTAAGTNLGAAIETCLSGFRGRSADPEKKSNKVIIIFSDGEDHTRNLEAAAEKAISDGVTVYTIGVGTLQGVPIPVFDERGVRTGFKQSRDGIVTTRLTEEELVSIAKATRGEYHRTSTSGAEIGKILERIAEIEKTEISTKQYTEYESKFQYVLAVGFLLLVVETVASEKDRNAA